MVRKLFKRVGIVSCLMFFSWICFGKVLSTSTPAKVQTTSNGKPIIFVTNRLYDGQLGGITGANQICQQEAYLEGSIIPSGLSFSALIVTAKQSPCDASGQCSGAHASPSWPLRPFVVYYQPDGNVFNTVNKNAIFDGQRLILQHASGKKVKKQMKIWNGTQSILSSSTGKDIVGWASADVNVNQDHEIYATYSPADCLGFTTNSMVKNGSAGEIGVSAGMAEGVVPPNTWGSYFVFSDNNSGFVFNMWITSEVLLCNAAAALVCVSH